MAIATRIQQLKAEARAIQIQITRKIRVRQQGVGQLEAQLQALYAQIDGLAAPMAQGVL